MSLASAIRPNPTTTPAEARARFAKLAARDDARISEAGRSRLIAGDARVRTAIVLIHGFTNCPQQWMTFAQDFSPDDYAIVIPRLPGHGYADRSSRSIGRVTTEELVATVNEATDIAAGFSDRIVLAGLSIGGAIGVWLALARSDVATTVSIVPFFGISKFDAPSNAFLAWFLVTLPDFFVPWDPSGKNTSVPPYGYTHFPTRVLGECLHVGISCYDAAIARVPAGNVHFLLNAKEPACNNELSLAIANRFERDRPASTKSLVLTDLPANHDIIDPTNPEARIDIVYPQVRALIDG